MEYYSQQTPEFILDPGHDLKVALIGAGGTGSQVSALLARMHTALKAMDRHGFDVTVFDGDTVSESNVGRQLFSPYDIGERKSVVTVNRINRFFGTDWKAKGFFKPKPNDYFNILISCTDTIKSRKEIANWARKNNTDNHYREDNCVFFWLDFGNGKNYGQAIMAMYDKNAPRLLMPTVFDVYKDIEETEDTDEPSCSLAQALKSQDLYVNSTLANLGMNLLWKVFIDRKVEQYGVVMDLKSLTTRSFKTKEKKENGKDNNKAKKGSQAG